MKSEILKVRITPEQKQFLQFLADQTNLDISKVVRFILNSKIAELNENSNQQRKRES
jgi:antitoxin component of RelBE/YafQ-DinJ toxin-antitoxin module